MKFKLDDRVYDGIYGNGRITDIGSEGYTVRFDRNGMLVKPFTDKELSKAKTDKDQSKTIKKKRKPK